MSVTSGGALTCRTFHEGVSEMMVHHLLWAPGILVPSKYTLQGCHSDHGACTVRGTSNRNILRWGPDGLLAATDHRL